MFPLLSQARLTLLSILRGEFESRDDFQVGQLTNLDQDDAVRISTAHIASEKWIFTNVFLPVHCLHKWLGSVDTSHPLYYYLKAHQDEVKKEKNGKVLHHYFSDEMGTKLKDGVKKRVRAWTRAEFICDTIEALERFGPNPIPCEEREESRAIINYGQDMTDVKSRPFLPSIEGDTALGNRLVAANDMYWEEHRCNPITSQILFHSYPLWLKSQINPKGRKREGACDIFTTEEPFEFDELFDWGKKPDTYRPTVACFYGYEEATNRRNRFVPSRFSVPGFVEGITDGSIPFNCPVTKENFDIRMKWLKDQDEKKEEDVADNAAAPANPMPHAHKAAEELKQAKIKEQEEKKKARQEQAKERAERWSKLQEENRQLREKQRKRKKVSEEQS